MTFSIIDGSPEATELLELYRSVGWDAYTADETKLIGAVANSHLVLLARDGGGKLVGLVRTVSDGLTIAYVQDLLVAPTHQRQGVGGALMDEVLRRAAHIRQVVLLTDAEPGQRAFYESRGLVEIRDFKPAKLRSFIRMG